MNENSGGLSCSLGCWAMAAGVGALVTVLLLVLGNTGWIGSIFLGGVAFALLGLLFSWLFCAPLPKIGEVKPGQDYKMHAVPPASVGHASSVKKAPGAATAAASAPSAKAETAETSAKKSDSSASSAATEAAAATTAAASGAMKPSKALSGEDDLAGRKGSWKYEGDNAAPAAKPEPTAKKASAPAAVEGPGKKPETLSQARASGADDLKRIKGIGPKMETLCNTLGFYHFDQIASWTAEEVAWVDQNLEGFKGRVTRDNWVEQAKLLATGGETEFSKRVDDGNVY